MAINAFEGARRIAKITAVIWIIGWMIAGMTFTHTPYIAVSYLIAGPGQPPTRIDEDNCNDDGKEVLKVRTKTGTDAWVTLCFRSAQSSGEEKVYFYRDTFASPWISPEVLAYTKRVKEQFVLPQADEDWIDNQSLIKYLKELGEGFFFAASGLLLLFALTWSVGWIVRGFMGIPAGQDSKSQDI